MILGISQLSEIACVFDDARAQLGDGPESEQLGRLQIEIITHIHEAMKSIERVVGMLRVVASRGRRGMRIGDVASISGLPMSTCFRMLQRLEVEGLVSRDALTRKYFLGPLLYELGLVYEKMGKKEDYIQCMKEIMETDYGYKDVATRVESSY